MADRLLEYVADGKGFLIITNYPKVEICRCNHNFGKNTDMAF